MTGNPKRGLILLNLGTPAAPEERAVRDYLKEFLMDPWVVDIPFPLRWLLVHGLILPKRPRMASAAYRKIWTERGSPLLVHHLDLTEKVRAALGPAWAVRPAMRYGSPSLEKAARELREEGVGEVVLFPLYPQYSLAATRSSVERARETLGRELPGVPVRAVPAFYEDPGFLDAFASVARQSLHAFEPDFTLFSFHGLPERQVRKTDPTGNHCLASGTCCDRIGGPNRDCYRAQCFATARGIASRLGLEPARFAVSFQSRLGRTPWIQPFTDRLYAELPSRGVRRLAVICPSFVADCLETLEEVAIRGRDSFLAAGGRELLLVPSLNASEPWSAAVAELARSNG
jgi:protoporphyrin/coproporphyrin ferrochelatase